MLAVKSALGIVLRWSINYAFSEAVKSWF